MTKLRFVTGDQIFRRGDPAECAYIIEGGRVRIVLDGAGNTQQTLAVLGPGEFFGEMALIDFRPRSATAIAEGDVALKVVGRGQIMDRLQETDPVVVHMIRTMSKRLRIAYGERWAKESDDDSDLLADLSTELAIREALADDSFVPFLQPIVHLNDASLAGFEVLVRWQSADGTLVPPADFVPLSERTGIVKELDRLVAHKALSGLADVANRCGTFVSLNLSPRHFETDDVVSSLGDIIRETGFPPSHVKLEVTEGILMKDPSAAAHRLAGLRSHGMQISLDDFGTGYSSLAYLHQFDFDNFKIDRSFVSGPHQSEKADRIVDAMVAIARALDMEIVAEGIETAEQARRMRGKGISYGQGWHFGKPLPLEEAIRLVASGSERRAG